MHATAECNVAVGVTVEKHVEGKRTLARVDVGGAVHDDDGGALFDRAAIGKFGVLRCHPWDSEWHWRLPAEQLFDRAGDAIGVLDELAAMFRMLSQKGVHAGERVAHCVKTRNE